MEEVTDDIDITEEEMLEVARAMTFNRREPGEMTATILSKQAGISRPLALIRLNQLERDGYLEKREVVVKGNRSHAFRPAGNYTWQEILEIVEERWGG